ncbi:hypothetical protein LZ30DRAFT_145089 [Colletotrichum cereale]|nr:hypothetical protein LZ30DRAFT_145089 [Colletotrichum cereale]
MEPRPVEGFPCQVPSCMSNPFPTKANLNRHVKSKHGPRVRMPCGKLLKYHPCNTQRHQKSCRACCRKLKVEGSHHEPSHLSACRSPRPRHEEPPGAPVPHDDSVYIDPGVLHHGNNREPAASEGQSQAPFVIDNQLSDDFLPLQEQSWWVPPRLAAL